MRRRDFLAKGTLAAGLAGSTGLLKPLMASETQPQKPSAAPEKAPKPAEEIGSPEFLNRSRKEKFPPKVPEFAASHLSPDVRVSPMPLEERLRRYSFIARILQLNPRNDHQRGAHLGRRAASASPISPPVRPPPKRA